jgi:hypothetical protein
VRVVVSFSLSSVAFDLPCSAWILIPLDMLGFRQHTLSQKRARGLTVHWFLLVGGVWLGLIIDPSLWISSRGLALHYCSAVGE